MAFNFRPATRDTANLLIGLCGSSGSGKTYSALRLATGLADGGPIAVIDTEGKRACMYAGDFNFQHCSFEKPFTPERYVQALDAAGKLKPAVVIIDSVSHVWEGPGGVLEHANKERERVKNDYAMWAAPKQSHQRFVNALLQTEAHQILCFRAKEKKIMVPNPDKPGKTMVVDDGWHPICDSALTYEMTINLLMSTRQKGSPIFDGFDFGKMPKPLLGLIEEGKLITEDTGRRLLAWCRGEQLEQEKQQHAAGALSVVMQDESRVEVTDLKQAGITISGCLGRKDVDHGTAVALMEANSAIVQQMAPAWQTKLGDLVAAKRDG